MAGKENNPGIRLNSLYAVASVANLRMHAIAAALHWRDKHLEQSVESRCVSNQLVDSLYSLTQLRTGIVRCDILTVAANGDSSQ